MITYTEVQTILVLIVVLVVGFGAEECQPIRPECLIFAPTNKTVKEELTC